MNYSQLKNAIAEVIRTNGNEEITGEVLQYTLLEMVSVLGKDYQFAGVGTPLTDTTERDDNVAWILGRGTYENFGNPFTVAVDEIAVVKYDGTFTVEKIKTGVVVDSELTLAGTNPVEGGAIAREFAKMRAAGYFFAGIMTPTGTPPHEITEKIFYLCTQAGVYPNFDSIVLDRGLNILKWNGSRWSADLVFAITDDVTEGLASLLTSAGAYTAIAAETQLRQDGDAAVQQNIDAVEALIPSQASVENKLVDEQKMNSSIATATATYRGSYNQVSNLNLGVDATHEQVALALASQITYLHITPDNNDYCYVLVPTSAETPTEIAHIDRYKFNGTAWGYEYTLNNSGYTAEQWAAINSGITSGLVAKLGALPTAQELAAALLAKQDVLTFDNAPTPSSTNPVTSGGVYTAIDDEKGDRVNADAALQQAIEAILLLIPSAATALNQLADKAFVNSSIATATATFRGTFNLVSDLQLTIDATHADIAAALLNAISGADNNDYAFVQIPTSVDTPTEIRVTERYKFNGTAWQYEYDLNNSGFTAQQWEAINSGITALLVTKLSNLPNATELATLFAGKQNVLTFDNAPVNGSDNPVKSGGLYDLFAAIDAKMPTGASANNKLVAEDRLAAYVGGIIGALDATFDLTSTDGHVTLRMTQTDGVIASLQILTSDIASASALATLGGQVSTNETDIANLQAAYAGLTQSDVIVGTLPSSGQQKNVIYRQPDQDHTPPQFYSDYMWNGTTWVLMATYNNAIDPRPKKASQNLVTSGGVFDNMGALDVSELNATENPHTLAQYVDLSAALAAVPTDYQKGGMSVKFVQSSDNKYLKYRLMADEWSTDGDSWLSENLDNAPTFRSKNLLTSGTINKAICTNLGKIDFCKLVRVSGTAGYEFGYAASPTCFLTELFDISGFVSVTWKYHDLSNDLYLAIYDENKNIIGAWGADGGQRTILVSDMQTGAKYVRATFDWTNHSTFKDWALIGTDSNDVQTVLWDESHLESEIVNSIDDLDSRVTALENPINDDSEKLFYEGSVEQPTLNSNRLNHDGSLISYGGNTYKTSKLIAVNYGDIITFTGATDGSSAPLIGYSKKEYGTTYFVEDLMPAAGLENDKLFTKSVKITNHNIKYVASCGYVKQGTYTFKVTCEAGHETIEDMIVMSSLHNYYPNAMSKAGGFVQKYLGGEDVNIVLLGDSITAVANQKQNTNLDKIPCFMEHQNWCYWLWKYLYKNDNIIYRRYDYPSFFSYTGDFIETSINSIEPYNYISSDENAAFQFDWNLANYEKTNIILPKNGSQCYQGIKIEVLSNNAATDGIVEYYNGTTWVEANGVVLSLRLSADPDGTSTCRNMRHKFRRVGASGTVSIRVSKNGTEGYLQLWGVEQWNGQGVFISNAAWGGMATYELQSGHQTSLMGHRPDLVLFELTLVNNFGDRMYESNSKELMYNDFYDYIWGDRPDHANALSLKTLSNDWADWQVILVIPHWRQQWVDDDDFKMTIEGTPVKYSALDCYNVVKGLIKSKNDIEYLDLGSNMKQEAIKRGWTLEQSYAGTTDETMDSIKCFTQDTVHLNNLGSKIYGMYIAPIFDI